MNDYSDKELEAGWAEIVARAERRRRCPACVTAAQRSVLEALADLLLSGAGESNPDRLRGRQRLCR